ncbi:hypothetical protein K504DRAFT_446243 [Pleomassaria siparia CBS 279.74]|uniref:Uncharacterized protein n=1 Tax=Pleomassaria siparia CBS 279.74 TaxID=1314801 RepID=A0A6G1KRX8_9PLEO|nr:hypothetical protein K504DRAFT_446243 [Pleomassaria siparia CBS 279.74]
MSPYPTVLPTRRERLQRRQQTIAETRQPRSTSTPTRKGNLGPLTTTFNPPAHCTRPALACATCSSARAAQVCRTQLNGQKSQQDTDCWPQVTAAPRIAPQGLQAPLGFYSPGIMCPMGYATACAASVPAEPAQTTAPARDGGNFDFPLSAGESGFGCCPQGYSCARLGGRQTCRQILSSTKISDAVTCQGTLMIPLPTLDLPFTTSSKTVSAFTIYAPMIQLIHQASDLLPPPQYTSGLLPPPEYTSNPIAPTSQSKPTTPSSTSQSKQTTPSSIPLPPSAAEKQNLSNTDKLSRTEISGIVVGCVILVLSIIAIFAFLWVRKRQPRHLTPDEAAAHAASKEKALRSSTTTTATTNLEDSPRTTPKVHSLNAFSMPIPTIYASSSSYPSPESGQQSTHMSTSQLGFPNSPQPLMSTSPLDFPMPPKSAPAFPSPPRPGTSFSNSALPVALKAGAIPRKPVGSSPKTSPGTSPVPTPTAFAQKKMEPALTSPTLLRLGVQDDAESPIDGSSPFRLKRGNTLKKTLSKTKSLKRSKSRPRGRERARSISPLRQDDGCISPLGNDDGMGDWTGVLKEGNGLGRNVSAVTEPGTTRKIGVVMERVPETVDRLPDFGTWKSRKASVITLVPGGVGSSKTEAGMATQGK